MSTGSETLSQVEIEARLNQFEALLNDLKHSYDRYFNGLDRRPPNDLQGRLTRQLRVLEHKTHIQSTALKFRRQSLVQRHAIYKQRWDRITRQIEEGTYTRDLLKAKRSEARHLERSSQAEATSQGPIELDLELDAIDDLDRFAREIAEEMEPAREPVDPPKSASQEGVRERKLRELRAKLGIEEPASSSPHAPSREEPPRAPRAAPKAVAGGAAASGGSDETMRRAKLDTLRKRLNARAARAAAPAASEPRDRRAEQVYRNLIEAKRRCNEPTQDLSYESVARSMAEQRDRLRQSHNAQEVDFKVVIRAGRAYLKPETK